MKTSYKKKNTSSEKYTPSLHVGKRLNRGKGLASLEVKDMHRGSLLIALCYPSIFIDELRLIVVSVIASIIAIFMCVEQILSLNSIYLL